jgi:long-subunit fatty acid transport protein
VAKPKSEFWKKVQFGGNVGLGFGTGFTNVSLSPTAYYNVNEKFATGFGLIGSYVSQKSVNNNPNVLEYKSTIFGANVIGLYNVIPEIQTSLEVEQLRVYTNFTNSVFVDDKFWNTAIFVGLGYRTNNAAIGIRYNVLFKENNGVYAQAWMPFVRVMF